MSVHATLTPKIGLDAHRRRLEIVEGDCRLLGT